MPGESDESKLGCSVDVLHVAVLGHHPRPQPADGGRLHHRPAPPALAHTHPEEGNQYNLKPSAKLHLWNASIVPTVAPVAMTSLMSLHFSLENTPALFIRMSTYGHQNTLLTMMICSSPCPPARPPPRPRPGSSSPHSSHPAPGTSLCPLRSVSTQGQQGVRDHCFYSRSEIIILAI